MIKGKTYEETVGAERAKEIKAKLSKATKALNLRGDRAYNWVGDNFKSLSGVHDWIRSRKKKPRFCEHCKKVPPIDLSLKNGREYSRDINDYDWLCRRCHMIYDGRIKPRMNKCKKCGTLTNNKFFCSDTCRKIFETDEIINRRVNGDLYLCNECNKFLSRHNFTKANKKMFGITTFCKRCISKKYYISKRETTPILDKKSS